MSDSAASSKARYLFRDGNGTGGLWEREVIAEGASVTVEDLLKISSVVAVYCSEFQCYAVASRESLAELAKGVLCAPWVFGDADKFRIKVRIFNSFTGGFVESDYTVDREKLVGGVGRALRAVGDLCYRSGGTSVVVSTVLWVQAFLSNSLGCAVAAVPLVHVIIGFFLGLGVLGLGVLLNYIYERKYFQTPAAVAA